MHDKQKPPKHHPHHRPFIKERPCKYQFILLNADRPIGCVKGYDDEEGQDVVIYVCGMKNTFHIGEYITRHAMKDFLMLASSPVFTQTFFGAKIRMPGFDHERQLFCVVQNVQTECFVSSSILEEDVFEIHPEDKPFNLDIYPDYSDDDNTVAEPKMYCSITEEEDNESTDIKNPNEDSTEEDGNVETDHRDPISSNEDQDHRPYFESIVNLCIEDQEYGVLLDIDITGFADARKPPKHHPHHNPNVPEFDEDPTDDMDLCEDNSERIDNVVKDMYFS